MNQIILINCPDTAGIINAVTNFIFKKNGNVVYLDQHVDKESGVFFMRIEAEFDTNFSKAVFSSDFENDLASTYKMVWQLFEQEHTPKMALFVSKYNHCLYDLLSRFKSGELNVEIPFILSNHKDLAYIADQFELPFHYIPVSKNNKLAAEEVQIELLKQHQVDFVVLARYMQIIGPNLIAKFPNRIINIHHSFLPAFAGAKPYHAAFKRGVKIIGATSHYVTEELDAGPIIEQDVVPVSHTHSIKDFVAKGRDLEKIVLARAVQRHISRKTMVYNNKTIIFT